MEDNCQNINELNKTMYFNAKPDILEAARILRRNITFWEKLLWEELKRKQICGLRFRRQIPLTSLLPTFIVMKFDYSEKVISGIENIVKERLKSPPWGI